MSQAFLPEESKKQKLRLRIEINEARENKLSNIFGNNKIKDMNKHKLEDELSNQNFRNQPFLLWGKICLDGKLVEVVMPSEDVDFFEFYSKSFGDYFDEGWVTIHPSSRHLPWNRQKTGKIKRSEYHKVKIIVIKQLVKT